MQKFLLVSSLSVISLLLTTTTSVKAQNIDSHTNSMTPRKLVSLARQGRFNAQGIPGYSRFGSAVRSGKVNAENLVASAIAQDRLPESTLQNRDFMNELKNHLKAGGCSSS